MNAVGYSKAGVKLSTQPKLDKSIFGLRVESHDLLKTAYLANLSNKRNSNATTKTRGLIRGGGRKPWRQKGTGRARFGSSRNPIWRGGGIVFGPTGNENHTKKLNTAAKRQAVRQALTLSAKENKVIILESIPALEGKTKDLAKLLEKVSAKGNILLVVNKKDQTNFQASSNLSNTKVSDAMYLNVFDILNADNVVISQKALETISSWLGTKAKPSKEGK